MQLEAIIGIISAIGSVCKQILSDEGARKTLFGTYTDGTARSIPDMINNEFTSPKSKQKASKPTYSNQKKKKKKKGDQLRKNNPFRL